MKAIRHSYAWLTVTAASLLFTTTQTQAVLISGNSVDDDSAETHIGMSVITFPVLANVNFGAAIGFTMPGQSYTLTDVMLRLSNYDGPIEAKVSIYRDDGSGFPGVLHALLTDPAAAASPDNYLFTPSGLVTLSANTSYLLFVQYEDEETGVSGFEWMGASDAPAGVATFEGGLRTGLFTGPLFGNPRYEINGNLIASPGVPEAGSTLPLLGIALAGMGWLSRRRIQAAALPNSL